MFQRNDRVVYLPDGPGAIGVITGNHHGDEWEVRFGPSEKRFIPVIHLRQVPEDESLVDMFSNARFSGIDDYRRVFSRLRLSGELTNLVYSMGNTKTKFLAHQFVPVLKFLASSKQGLLIADEVGLGKTIEAMFIWQELRARDNANRLLIVAPAVLKAKWLGDIEKFFDVDAREASADTILQCVEEQTNGGSSRPFAYVSSIQGLRGNDKLIEVLRECRDEGSLFDLVIIDEAHYMRNDETRSYELGELLRDTAEHLLLLSATPIQTSAENFRNLLRLLAPSEFGNEFIFQRQLEDFRPIVRLTNALDGRESATVLRSLLDEAIRTRRFASDSTLQAVANYLDEVPDKDASSPENRLRRIQLIEQLRSKFFYSEYVTRMRKKDVLEGRAQRDARSISFSLSAIELQFYNAVTAYLRGKDNRDNPFQSFRLIARQRQMASCMPAALLTWRNEPLEVELRNDSAEADSERDLYAPVFAPTNAVPMPHFPEIDLEELERNDTKFKCFLSELRNLLRENPKEKIVVFSFFRGTVNYLHARLANENISSISLLGGLSPDEKKQRLALFADPGGNISVLLSTEVGSEGIDLQFARIEINYDLPWNPMRLEQRIGRIDRIGQPNPIIYIYNAYCPETIEDRVLLRLHERIRTFQDVLGDLDEILGKKIRDIELEVFRNPEPTDEQITKMVEQVETVKVNTERLTADLHEHADLLTEYQSYVLEGIKRSRSQNRLLTGDEIRFLVTDYLNGVFPGSTVTPVGDSELCKVSLSTAARDSLRQFIAASQIYFKTELSHFDIKSTFGGGAKNDNSDAEVIDINHPLVRWMVSRLKTISVGTGCNSISVPASAPDMPKVNPGLFVYYVQLWNTIGIVRSKELKHFVVDCRTGALLPLDDGEQLLSAALLNGRTFEPTSLTESEWQTAHGLGKIAYDAAWKEKDKCLAKQTRLDEDEKIKRAAYLNAFFDQKVSAYRDSIEKRPGDVKFARMQEGKIKKLESDREKKISELSRKSTRIEPSEIAIGLLKVEGDAS